MPTNRKTVYVVHCIDVEGPMHEPVEATFERLRNEDGIDVKVEPTEANLNRLQEGSLDLGVDETKKTRLLEKYSKYNLGYLRNWTEIDEIMDEALSLNFRQRYADSIGGGYKFSWFIFDQYGFANNPRLKVEGVHCVFDHYVDRYLSRDPQGDGLYWHYHHPPASGDAIEWNTNLLMNSVYEEILARRIIDRQWFPGAFRAGGHIERNDLSHWLEMFVPFDYSGRTPHGMDYAALRGDVCDWRFAPTTWGAWHPDWYDYRRTGSMKRWIFRCLDLRTWITSMTERDVHEAFEQAAARGNTILAYYNHDYRDMRDDMVFAHGMVSEVAKQYPEIEWRYANALEAARAYLGVDDQAPNISYELCGDLLTIRTDRPLFGPMPFLAIKEDGKYFRDNPTQESATEWCYRFRKPHLVEAFGLAGNSPMGHTGVVVETAPFG